MTFRRGRRYPIVIVQQLQRFDPYRFECCLGKAITFLRALVARSTAAVAPAPYRAHHPISSIPTMLSSTATVMPRVQGSERVGS